MSQPPRAQLFASYGVCFRIQTQGAIAWTRLRAALPPGAKLRKRGDASRAYGIVREGARFTLSVDGTPAVSGVLLADVLGLMEKDVALHVAANAPEHVFIHAGVVGHRGRALVLPGRSFSGKSTLVERLVAEGASYYSDEYAVLDKRGRVLPYPRPISLRRAGSKIKRVVPSRCGRKSLAVGWVIGSKYDADTAFIEARPLSAGRTALLLMDNAVAARIAPARVLPAVRQAALSATGMECRRGDARRVARALLHDCV